MIKLTRLNKYFFKNKKNQIHVLNDVSLDIADKGLVAIHGPSGSGKTTLLNVIGGLDKINSGQIDFFDHHLNRYNARIWDKIRNQHVGYIFQNYYLLPELSVYENIRFVLKIIGVVDEEYIEQKVHYVLKAVGMYPFRKKKALQLSGGQQQRVAIARALVKNPEVVIADEPTGNLDSKNTLEIMNIIKEIAKDKLVILVTHEKKLASIYADRIISIEDGKVIGDIVNSQKADHEINDENIIYLKDIKQKEVLKNNKVNFDIYLEEGEEESSFDVKLIVRNKTLYVDIKSPYQKIKLADKSSGVIIKDEHYQKKSKEESLKTSFKTEDIDHSKIKKERRMILSFKQTFKMAFAKIRNISRKGKLMLFSFFISGMITAYAIAALASVAVVRVDEMVYYPKGYVQFEKGSLTYEELDSLATEQDGYYINVFPQERVYFINSDGTKSVTYFSGQYDLLDHAKNYKLSYGRYAASDNEIVISQGIVDEYLSSSTFQDFGIWNKEQLFKEFIEFGNQKANIVGIVKTKTKLIFASEAFLLYVNSGYNIKPFAAYHEVLSSGSAPDENEVVISEMALVELGYMPQSAVYPLSADGKIISGTHNISQKGLVLFPKTKMMKIAIEESSTIYAYTKNPKALIQKLDTEYNIEAFDIYKAAVNEATASQRVNLAASLGSTLLLISFSLLGFYFVIRSSMISRIYEVSVYRALGVRKKDIFRSFIVEIFTITTISSLIGLFLMNTILIKLQRGLLGMLNVFYVNTLTSVVGVLVVYGLNLSAGILPVLLLLRKTPAQILAQYDI